MTGNTHQLFNIADAVRDFLASFAPGWIVYLAMGFLGVVGILAFVVPAMLATSWVERKLIGRFQVRYGPNRVGYVGLLQPLADVIKLMTKEALMPSGGDKWVFLLAPVTFFVPTLLVYAVLPFGPGLIYTDLNIGLLYILAVSSLSVVSVFMAGWASNNKYSLLGAMRSVAQMVSYEIPMVLALLGVVLLVGSLKMSAIVEYQLQHAWLVLLQPLGFFAYFISATAELNRTPTDIMEGESEIVAGYHTEFSGMKFGLFYAAEYTNVLAVSAILSAVFFGGWSLPLVEQVLPPWLIFIGKIWFFFFIFVWMRGTLPRLRIDQLMAFAWKFLLPLALLNILITSLEVYLELSLWLVFAVNLLAAVGLVVLWAQIFGQKGVVVGEPRPLASSGIPSIR